MQEVEVWWKSLKVSSFQFSVLVVLARIPTTLTVATRWQRVEDDDGDVYFYTPFRNASVMNISINFFFLRLKFIT